MTLRKFVPIAILAVGLAGACKDKEGAGGKTKGGVDLDGRCRHLAAACGDQSKHIDQIEVECKQLAKTQTEKGCADKATAVYECYEKELCGKADKVWAIDDLRVLGERQKKCVAERAALMTCVGK